MGKIILSFVLLILGVASCFAVPTILAMDFIPTTVVEVETGDETFRVEKPALHLISIGRPRSALSSNPMSTVDRDDIPEGDFAFVETENGSRIEVSRGDADFSGQDMTSEFVVIGGAQLQPGTYGVAAPEVGEGLTLSVMKTNFDPEDEGNLETMGVGVLVGFGLGGLLVLAALVFLILGIVDASRRKNTEG